MIHTDHHAHQAAFLWDMARGEEGPWVVLGTPIPRSTSEPAGDDDKHLTNIPPGKQVGVVGTP